MRPVYASPFRRSVARCLLVLLLIEPVSPFVAGALTGGPQQPEFSTFEPASSSGMVDQFSGAFTYNLPLLSVPGPQGSGYPLSLSYHSGSSIEDEASWVGFGWTLNPGAINRQLRGYPDDVHSYPVRTYNKRPAVTTTAVELSESAEIMSFDKFSPTDTTQIGSVGENARLRLVHNSETGFRAVFSAGIQSLGVGLGLEASDEGLSFRPSLNIYSLASGLARLGGMKRSKDPIVNAVVDNAANSVNTFQGSFLNWISTSEQQLSVTPSTGWSVRLSAGLTTDAAFLPIGFEGRISGSYSETSLNPVTDRKAFGYFYSSSADEQSLMDYHTEKLDPYSERTLFLGIPFSLPDVFSVSGEGIGGSFRGHSTVAGQYYPPLSKSNHSIYHLDLSPHVGTTFGMGVSAGVGSNTVTRPC